MESYRTLKIYGNRTPNVKYTVLVDGKLVNTSNKELYAFETSTKFHGGLDITIDVQEGELTLTHATATYPAKINDVIGTITMMQPIKDPIAIMSNGVLTTIPFDIVIKAGQHFSYKHLMFNGPTIWTVFTKNITPGADLFIGDFLKKEFPDYIAKMTTEYMYDKIDFDIYSEQDLNELIKYASVA